MREEDIPSGTWLCLNCRMTQKVDTNAGTVDSELSNIERPKSAAGDGEVVDDATLSETRKLRKRSNSHLSGVSGTSEKSTKQPQPVPTTTTTATPIETNDADKAKSPFDELIKAAAILNPRQFELPRNMSIFVQFPGGDKSE